MADDIQQLPISLNPTPQPVIPPQLQLALAAAQQQAAPQPSAPQAPIPPITQTPEFQSVMQAGQGSFGVPGYNEQGQLTQPQGAMGRLKRALSDAVFAIGEGLTKGPGVGVLSAMPQGREFIHTQRSMQAEQMRAQQMEQLGMAQGRMYAGFGAFGRGVAAQQNAAIRGIIAPAEIAHMQAQANLANQQAGAVNVKVTPVGLYDMRLNGGRGGFVQGASYNQPVTITPELRQQFPALAGFQDGEVLTPNIIAGIYRSSMWVNTPVQTGLGVSNFNRLTGKVGPPQAPPAALGRPETVINPQGGQPALTTAQSAISQGLTPITPSMGMNLAGTKGQLQDIQFNLNRVRGLIKRGVFDNLDTTTKAKLIYAMNQPDSRTQQVLLSDILPSLSPDQVQAISVYPQLMASISSMRQLLGKAPARTEKQWEQFMSEAPSAAELLSGSNVAAAKLEAFQNAFDNLKEPMQSYFSGTPQGRVGARAGGGSSQKIAPMAAIEAFAAQNKMTKAQAMAAFKSKGYRIEGQ